MTPKSGAGGLGWLEATFQRQNTRRTPALIGRGTRVMKRQHQMRSCRVFGVRNTWFPPPDRFRHVDTPMSHR